MSTEFTKIFAVLVGCAYNVAMLELLAPAGDLNSFEAAINCGADAVYLGLSDFNARRKAENFTAENIGDIVRRAHFFGVKVYITVNTLVRDNEMQALLSLVRSAVEAKADAFIVQDLGAALCLRRAFPDIVLHASTQLGVHNLYGARAAERMGFKRVVLSRETKLEDIRAIREGTSLEIEYFVQGALCVAFSGNCYLSSTECGASGNRGLCKQLCRLPYRADTGDCRAEGYLLSAKDLCLADSLSELADAGVTSFKIEGRLRREGYVGSAVAVYRRIIDGLGAGARLTEKDRQMLKIAYSRGGGYNERAYLDDGVPDGVIERGFNNHTGIYIGEVAAVSDFKTDLYKVVIKSTYPLSKGDGLKFYERGGGREGVKSSADYRETASLGIGDILSASAGRYEFVTKVPLKAGWRVHLISSRSQDESVLGAVRKVSVGLEVNARTGEPLVLIARAENGATARAEGGVCERAKNAPLSAKDIANQASKTADSGFAVDRCDVHTDGVFIPKSQINALRRELFEKLSDSVVAANEREEVNIDESALTNLNVCLNCDSGDINYRFVRSDELNDIKEIYSGACDVRKIYAYKDCVFVLCPSAYSAREIKRMLDVLDVPTEKIALQLPVIANGKDLKVIERLLEEFPYIRTLVSENIYGFEFVQKGYSVIAGAGHNVLNGYAETACREQGAFNVLPSIEAGSGKNVSGEELPLMTFAHCPYKTVYGTDCAHCRFGGDMKLSREGREYRLRRTKIAECYFGLF